MAAKGSWLLRRPPEDNRPLLLGFPYAGAGAGSYRNWPVEFGGAWFCPVQPPGREGRFSEPPMRTAEAWATDFAEFFAPYCDRPYAFIGHCGGVPLALSSIVAIDDLGLPPPVRLFASSWGAPHRRLYGRLNFIDLQTADLVQEVRDLYAQMGVTSSDDFIEIAAETLRVDLELHRPHLHDASRRLPCPVTVIGWTEDDVVPAATVLDGWDECGDVSYECLTGGHFSYLEPSADLVELVGRQLGVGSPLRS